MDIRRDSHQQQCETEKIKQENQRIRNEIQKVMSEEKLNSLLTLPEEQLKQMNVQDMMSGRKR